MGCETVRRRGGGEPNVGRSSELKRSFAVSFARSAVRGRFGLVGTWRLCCGGGDVGNGCGPCGDCLMSILAGVVRCP